MPSTLNWVAVKELKLSYYIGETLLFTIYTHYGNLIKVPYQQPSKPKLRAFVLGTKARTCLHVLKNTQSSPACCLGLRAVMRL